MSSFVADFFIADVAGAGATDWLIGDAFGGAILDTAAGAVAGDVAAGAAASSFIADAAGPGLTYDMFGDVIANEAAAATQATQIGAAEAANVGAGMTASGYPMAGYPGFEASGGMSAADWAKLGVSTAGNLLGAGVQAWGANKAAGAQKDAGMASLELQREMYNRNLALSEPWRKAGTDVALPALTAGLQPGGQFNKPYTLADFQSGPQSGLYQFARGEGLSAMGNRAAAGGQAQSTGATVGAGKLATDLASQYYNTGYQQNLQQNSQTLGGLQSLAGLATNQTTAAQTAGTNLATSGTGTLQGIGNVQAAGQVAGTNAAGQAISSFGNTAASIPGAMQALANLFA